MSTSVNCHHVTEVEISQDSFWIELKLTDKNGSITEVTAFAGGNYDDSVRRKEAREMLVGLKEQIDKLLSE